MTKHLKSCWKWIKNEALQNFLWWNFYRVKRYSKLVDFLGVLFTIKNCRMKKSLYHGKLSVDSEREILGTKEKAPHLVNLISIPEDAKWKSAIEFILPNLYPPEMQRLKEEGKSALILFMEPKKNVASCVSGAFGESSNHSRLSREFGIIFRAPWNILINHSQLSRHSQILLKATPRE